MNTGTIAKPVYHPAEVCTVIPGQPSNAKLDANQTSQMIGFAVRPPGLNAQSIVSKGFNTVGLSPSAPNANPVLATFGMTTILELLTVPGRMLKAPTVEYQGKNNFIPRFATWNLEKYKCLSSGKPPKWAFLIIESVQRGGFTARNSLNLGNFGPVGAQFHKTLLNTGVNAPQPANAKALQLDSNDDVKLQMALKKGAEELKFDLVVVVVPDDNPGLYNEIKQIGDVRVGIQTICVVGKKLGKTRADGNFDLQYMANVALKFNLKMGGRNHRVVSDGLKLVDENKTMFLGIDVTHPSPGSSSKAPSVASMVANIDPFLSQWPAELRVQKKDEQDPNKRSAVEMVQQLTDMLKRHLKRWLVLGKHTSLPENIVVYRDGVSEGQYQLVLDKELPLLKAACTETYPPQMTKAGFPRFSIIIVGKRHHTRFYPTDIKEKDRSNNPRNGTIVDRGITQSRQWDFFLQAHAAIKGTARPAHYYVILDQVFRGRKLPAGYRNAADALEELTHNMSYQFGRATKAVSLCPPAYYADIACERARRYLYKYYDPLSAPPSVTSQATTRSMSDDITVHEKLEDTMFYI